MIMSLEPKTFFVGMVDFFSVLLPGALLTLFIQEDPHNFLSSFYKGLNDVPTWVVFLFIAYVLGHLIFLVGALLDDYLYDPIRNSTPEREIDRLTAGKDPPSALDRFLVPVRRILAPVSRILTPVKRILAAWLVKKESDNALDQAIVIKDYYVNNLGLRPVINAFQWCKARLALDNRAEAPAVVQRFEADSKFFRSFAVVIIIFFFRTIYDDDYPLALVSLLLFDLGAIEIFRPTTEGHESSLLVRYHYGSSEPYWVPPDSSVPRGGVVYRRIGELPEIEYLIIQAKDDPSDWVLPKGHIEPNESARTAAVREVSEETGILARIESELGTTSFELGKEHVEVQFYLMEVTGSCEPQETRLSKWLPIKGAVESITHKESRKMLLRAQLRLESTSLLVPWA
jgi:8-oxo-dGTP pyrophosphatase MutT (NUDIX family)